ncbi:sphingosine 1-phosphate receptor 1-like [Branchiostoma floridae]|uniref:Sphingosine 1-phosphate receptor 1-like n=1 Tax=Branchiostoma floridae TaxID=7739 RepID=A0A9J7N180_BRAFL|nr:sphingosine 1-phosphate receptor 1-like [Branchiostoma floridae]
MFNNSSVLQLDSNKTSVHEFDGPVPCLLWYLLNTNVPYSQAEEACSMYFKEFETGTTIIYGLTSGFIIITNAAVLWGIIGKRQLHTSFYFYMANLSLADILAGIALLCYPTVVLMGETSLYSRMIIATVVISSQVLSASALALQSGNSYIAVRHPTYFHNHADTANRNAGVAIVSSWLLSLLSLAPIMGWNCLDMPTQNCSTFYYTAYLGLVGGMIILLAITSLFTTISAFIALKQRQKNRFGQLTGAQPIQGNSSTQNRVGQNQPHNLAQKEAERKDQKSLNKIKTVLTYVGFAFMAWLLPLVLTSLCHDGNCLLPTGARGMVVLITLNSAINPIVSLVRTPDLRKAVWQNMTAIYRVPTALVTMIRGNLDNPRGVQGVPLSATNMQGGAVQNTPAGHSNAPVNLALAGPDTASLQVMNIEYITTV